MVQGAEPPCAGPAKQSFVYFFGTRKFGWAKEESVVNFYGNLGLVWHIL
jgi:hypothetical protein